MSIGSLFLIELNIFFVIIDLEKKIMFSYSFLNHINLEEFYGTMTFENILNLLILDNAIETLFHVNRESAFK